MADNTETLEQNPDAGAVGEENDGSTSQTEDMTGEVDPLEGDEEAQNAVKELFQHFGGLEKFTRRQEVMETRQQRYYARNDQYIYWNDRMGVYILAQGTGGGAASGDTSPDMPKYMNVYNIYTPYLESILSPLLQNPPGVNFEPDDIMEPPDVRKAKIAQKYKQKVDRDNNRKQIQQEVGRLFVTDGRVVIHTRTIKDQQALGTDAQGKPASKQLITVYGVLESKVVPIAAKDRSELVALFLFADPEINLAKEKYPSQAVKIKDSSAAIAEQSYEKIARLGVLQGARAMKQASDGLKHLSTEQHGWLRPAAFNHLADDLKTKLQGKFKKGLHAVFVGDVYCSSRDESMDDHTAIGWPAPGDGMRRPSMGKRLMPLQDAFNDGMNMMHEANEECVPRTYVDEECLDVEAIDEQVSQPDGTYPVKKPVGMASLADAFYVHESAGVPATLQAALEFIQGPLAQFITGAVPTLIGDADPDNKTKGGIQLLRDAALGRVGIPWGQLQELFAEVYRQSVNDAEANAAEGQTFTYAREGRRGTAGERVNMDDLKQGKIRSIPDTDSSFPESTSAKRGTFLLLADKAANNPVLARTMSQPDTIEYGMELLGLPDIEGPDTEARQKQLEEIEQLLKERPIPPTPEDLAGSVQKDPTLQQPIEEYMMAMKQVEEANATAGADGDKQDMPMPPQALWPLFKPSIDIDADWDFNTPEREEVQDWLSSAERREQERAGNHLGVLNVRLHGDLHKAAEEKQADANTKPDAPSMSMNFKDLPPEGQVQMASDAGIKLNPPPNPLMAAAAAAAAGQQGAPAGPA